MPYRIEYSPDARDHLRTLTARQQSLVLDTVDAQLIHQPGVETRNRKRMRSNPIAPWELRIGDLRVYYEILTAALIREPAGGRGASSVLAGATFTPAGLRACLRID